ncbi:hypothetical protein PBN151_3210 [Paenibacillus sp. NAIST15-1]|nr:hypothetical protein PBN151_3210 [Paenibacillus sp. NAIST15-1]
MHLDIRFTVVSSQAEKLDASDVQAAMAALQEMERRSADDEYESDAVQMNELAGISMQG